MKKGTVFAEFLQDIADFIAANQGQGIFEREFANLDRALKAYKEAQQSIFG